MRFAGGDARAALNGLAAAASLLPGGGQISLDLLEQALGQRLPSYDKSGDTHYDVTSALIKSIRGSDAGAALYWLARMEAAGEDPKFIARRLVIAASEDIGMARPGALAVAVAGFEAVMQVGPPECFINLAHVSAYLAECPKSWDAYQGLKRARQLVAERPDYPVPAQLRNASTELARQAGHGRGYVHASQPGAEQVEFLPPELNEVEIYLRSET